jgi:hypothetical protein
MKSKNSPGAIVNVKMYLLGNRPLEKCVCQYNYRGMSMKPKIIIIENIPESE